VSKHLSRKFCPQRDKEFCNALDTFIIQRFYLPRKGGPERDLKHKIKAAARELRYLSEEEGQTHYLLLPSCDGEDEKGQVALENIVRRLRAHYPTLVCLSLATDFELEMAERETFRPLLHLLPKVPKAAGP
jgi:hypothetical protein